MVAVKNEPTEQFKQYGLSELGAKRGLKDSRYGSSYYRIGMQGLPKDRTVEKSRRDLLEYP